MCLQVVGSAGSPKQQRTRTSKDKAAAMTRVRPRRSQKPPRNGRATAERVCDEEMRGGVRESKPMLTWT